MKALFAFLFLFVSTTTVLASPLHDMIAIHNDLDNMCRGWSGDDPHSGEICREREKVSQVIRKMGYCMAYPAYTWHRC